MGPYHFFAVYKKIMYYDSYIWILTDHGIEDPDDVRAYTLISDDLKTFVYDGYEYIILAIDYNSVAFRRIVGPVDDNDTVVRIRTATVPTKKQPSLTRES